MVFFSKEEKFRLRCNRGGLGVLQAPGHCGVSGFGMKEITGEDSLSVMLACLLCLLEIKLKRILPLILQFYYTF